MTLTENLAQDTSTDWTATAREIADELRSSVDAHDRSGEIDAAAFDRLRQSGVIAALVPTDFGGGGVSHSEMGSIIRELGRRDPATALTLSMHSHVVATQVWRHNHGMDAEKLFRKVADGAILISTGASDWVNSNGSTARIDGGYRVSARKVPASGCEVGQILVASSNWADAPDGPQVLHFAIPMSAEGISIEQTWDTLGLRATGSHTVVMDDVFVPEAAVALSRPADQWPMIWNVVLPSALPLIMSAYLGIADTAVERVTESLLGREDPHVLQLVGEMMNAHGTAADTISAMFHDAQRLNFEPSDQLSARTLGRKTVVATAAIDTVRLGIEATGGYGYTRASELERLYRDVHGCLFHPLPRAKQTRFTGAVELGLDPLA